LHPDSAWINLTHEATNGVYRWNVPIYVEPLDSVRNRITHVSGVCDTTGYFKILTPAHITEQKYYPESRELCEADTIIISTKVDGSNLSYQWYLNGQELQGQTEKDLFLPNATVKHSGRYKLVVIGQCKPDAVSDEISFVVKPATEVTKNPEDVLALKGDIVQFAVEAKGVNLEYQWQRDSSNIIGAKSAVYIIENVEESSEGQYRCVVTGECGTDTSQVAILKVQDASPVLSEERSAYLEIKKVVDYGAEIHLIITSQISEPVELTIVDLFGRNVKTLYKGMIDSEKEFIISKDEFASGFYLLSVKSNSYITREKSIITK